MDSSLQRALPCWTRTCKIHGMELKHFIFLCCVKSSCTMVLLMQPSSQLPGYLCTTTYWMKWTCTVLWLYVPFMGKISASVAKHLFDWRRSKTVVAKKQTAAHQRS
eukprot:PhF_6_TR29362/c0_g1_i1/m.43204